MTAAPHTGGDAGPGPHAMKLGVQVVDSTPPEGTYLGGYGRFLNAKGVRDRLRASVLVAEAPAERGVFVLLALDLVFAHEQQVARMRDAVRAAIGHPDAVVTVACSHSHSTPYATADAPAGRFQSYADHLLELCADAARVAWDGRQPAAMTFHRAPTDIGYNRRLTGEDGVVDFGWNEDGPTDDHVRVVAVRTSDGALLAVIANHGCHPTCMSPRSRAVSADWPGEMRKVVEAAVGAPCLFVQGGGADVNPRHEWIPGRFGEGDVRGPHAADTDTEACALLGGRVGAAVLQALESEGEKIATGPIAGVEERVPMPLVPEPGLKSGTTDDPMPYWHGVVRKRLPRWIVDKLLTRSFPWSTDLARSADDAGWEVPLVVQAVRVGGLAIAAHGSESFCETGRDAMARSPTPHTLFAGYSNGMIGYVPPAVEIPRRGYEVDQVPYLYRLPGRFAPEAEPAARERTAALLGQLFERA